MPDVRMPYDDTGHREDVLLLVHGHPFDRTMWRSQLEAAALVGWRAIAPDLRGYGGSTVTPGKVALDVFADDLAELLDELNVDRVALCGLSMGGQIVMEFCRKFPGRVRGIVLAATFPRAETDEGKRDRNRMADRLQAEGLDGYAQEVLPKMLAAKTIETRPDIADGVLQMMCRAPPEGAAAALRGRAERPAYESVLAGLAVPALIVIGDQDAFTSQDDAEEMHHLISGSKLVWMEGVGHMPNLEREADFNGELTAFLAKVRASRAGAET